MIWLLLGKLLLRPISSCEIKILESTLECACGFVEDDASAPGVVLVTVIETMYLACTCQSLKHVTCQLCKTPLDVCIPNL